MNVIVIKENKDGSADVTVEYSKLEAQIIKQILGVKRLTKKRIGNFIKDALVKYAHKEAEKITKEK